jgi:hypothetical protein
MKPVELPAAEPGVELAALVAERNELVRLRARNKIGIVVQTVMMAAFISLLSWSFVAGSIGLWPFVLLTAVVCGAGLGQRFLGSNHIRRPRRACRTMCGLQGGD